MGYNNSMNQPIVSVIIPVYNTGNTAKTLIEFLLNGEYQNVEILAVDDGSKDGSLRILKSIADSKGRLRVFHKENGGASSARNLALKKASGKYIAFIDSDDEVTPDYLTRLVKETEKPDVALTVSAYMYHRVRQGTQFPVYDNPLPPRKKTETFKSYILRLLLSDGRIYGVINKLFVTKIIQDNHLEFDTKLDFAEDTKFMLGYLSAMQDEKITFILDPLYLYHFGSPTSTVAKSSLKWENWEKSYQDVKDFVGPHPTSAESRRLKLLYKRFKISHALAVARANKPFKEKLEYASIFEIIPASLAVKLRR